MSRNARCSVPHRVTATSSAATMPASAMPPRCVLVSRGGSQVEEQHQAGGAQHDERGQQAAEGDAAGSTMSGVIAAAPRWPCSATWAISAEMVASVLPVNADG